MLTQDEHREACRVYMQKYRSKPENREKIRQQNAEYRKRKKQESIRQVSEIGSLETTLDGQIARINQLEKQLVESNFKVNLFEKEKLIPMNYLNIINQLRIQLSKASNEIEDHKNTIVNYQQQQHLLQQQVQQLQSQQLQQLELINAFGNGTSVCNNSSNSSTSSASSGIGSPSSPPTSSFSLPPTPTSSSSPIQSPFYNSLNCNLSVSNGNDMHIVIVEQNNNLVNKKQKTTAMNNLFNCHQVVESLSNHSTPPSSPSLQYLPPNSPVLPSSMINLSPSTSPTPNNSVVTSPRQSFINISNGNLSSLVPSEESGSNCSNSLFKPTSHFTLDLLCDVLQNEKPLQLPLSSAPSSSGFPSCSNEKRKSGDFKTSIDFVLNLQSNQQ